MQMWRHTLNQGAFRRKLTIYGLKCENWFLIWVYLNGVLCTDRDGLQSFSPLIDERCFGIRSTLHCEIGEFF
ncbi:hypothetical protein T05_10135 [Trichinella murrelli]|uniref:Uncharacterized protein n=1 Tax=Trichinella murrelli TaxID=144512 RepID=A0A0V0T7F4_9BILA|nr:hypothetical protein T05_10135 [Trichinella murrelli]